MPPQHPSGATPHHLKFSPPVTCGDSPLSEGAKDGRSVSRCVQKHLAPGCEISSGDRKGRPYEGDTDSHTSDVGHWLGMTGQEVHLLRLRNVVRIPCIPRRGDVGIAPYGCLPYLLASAGGPPHRVLLRHFVLVDNCPQRVQQNHYIPPHKTVITYENQETALTQPVKIASIKSSRNENVSGNDVKLFSSGQARQEGEP